MIFRKPIQPIQPQPHQKQKEKSCKRVIKRDEHGRIKSEEFVGCSKDEIRMMKEGEREKEDESY